MSKKYEPKRDWQFGVVIAAFPLIAWGLALTQSNLYVFCVPLAVSSLFAWIWFGTRYEIGDDLFIYRSGPVRGKIPIKKIKEITPHVRSWSGIRPALSFEYLKIRYNTYDDVFIAPKEEDKFIESMKEKNPEIIITN